MAGPPGGFVNKPLNLRESAGFPPVYLYKTPILDYNVWVFLQEAFRRRRLRRCFSQGKEQFMGIWKRLGTLVLAGALCLILLAGCAEDESAVSLSVCVGPAPESLDPIYAQTVGDQTILAHLYENLLRVAVDVSGNATVTSGMAKSVEQTENTDGTVTCTFRLRSAKWSDGRNVQATDFVYAWRRLADPANQSPYASLLSVVAGYEEAQSTGDMSHLQISAKNDSTFVVVLTGSHDWFLREVCTAPAAVPLRQDVLNALQEEADEKNARSDDWEAEIQWWQDPTALVTNGPYQAESYEKGSSLSTTANERYYGTAAGPAALTFHFAGTAEAAQTLYLEHTVDAVWPLTEERLSELSAQEDWTAVPELSTYTALFNGRREPLSDMMIRQSLCLAIDRDVLAEAAGPTAHSAEGLVPPGVPDSGDEDFREAAVMPANSSPESYENAEIQARTLLADAGYDSGTALGELEFLYVNEGNNRAVAEALCAMWREALQIQVTPRGMTAIELTAALRNGEYDMAGLNITAAANDAEYFLTRWQSDSPENVVGYTNSAYDTLMAIVATATDGSARLGCLHDAEELLLSDYALAPLYNTGTAWELRESLTGVCRDARGWFSFANVVTRPV